MGSLNATCIISGLPIESRDSVRFVALTKNKYRKDNEHICYVTGRWQPRTAPLKAVYNDYGSIEKIQKGLTEKVFFKSFDIDVVEKGVGDNQCHDVHVRKGMSQKEWLKALWEGRVFVDDTWPWKEAKSQWLNKSQSDKDAYVSPGIPTLTRIENILKEANFAIVTTYGKKGLIIDELTRGFIRVRKSHYNESKNKLLEKALQIINIEYAAMITCGTGNYSDDAEILVAPKPGIQGGIGGLANKEEIEERPVAQAMIREDVWQILLNFEFKSWEEILTIESFKKDAKEFLSEDYFLGHSPHEMRDWIFIRDRFRDNRFVSSLEGQEGVTGFYFKNAYELAKNLASSDSELESFVNDLVELIYVQQIYSSLHGQWHPTSNGDQNSNWQTHRKFLRSLLKIKGRWED